MSAGNVVAFALYAAAGLPYTLFVLLYGIRSPWWQTQIGRSLLLSKTVIAALCWLACLSLIFGDFPGRDALRIFVIGGAIVAGWWQFVTLVRLQHQPVDANRRRATDH